MTTPAYRPLVAGHARISGGDHLVQISLAPGIRVQLQVPAGSFDAVALTQIADHVVDHLTTPHGVTPSTRIGNR